MRSSKSRSRSKSNRPRSMGNIVNRVFDSSGPEGKVRGTPQQIIEKYLILARDAQLSNDRVAAENFMQHAEHFTRMLGEAQREMAAEQEARRQGQDNGNGNGQRSREDRGDDQPDYADRGGDRDNRQDRQDRRDAPRGGEVIDLSDPNDDNGLVETPETRPEPKADTAQPAPAEGDAPSEKRGRNRPRGPRKPRPADGGDQGPDQASAAE